MKKLDNNLETDFINFFAPVTYERSKVNFFGCDAGYPLIFVLIRGKIILLRL